MLFLKAKDFNLIKIAFLGDIILNNDYIRYYQNGINPFKDVSNILSVNDYVIGNLECMAKGKQGENLLKKPRLTTTVETLNLLKKLDINVVSLANNHVYDHLEDGFIKTTEFLNANKIQFLGAGLTRKVAEIPIIISMGNINIGLLNYLLHDTNPNLPADAAVFINFFEFDKAKVDIKLLKSKTDHVLVILHWGGRVAGGLFPDYDQPAIARKLIDIGADLIVGHHSHTVQPYELYKHKLIIYSLGNFCVSNLSFEGETTQLSKRGRIAPILRVLFQKNNYSFDFKFFENKGEFYIELKNYYLIIKLKNIIFKILFVNKFLWYFYFIHKSYVLPLVLFLKRNDIRFTKKVERILLSIQKRIK